MWTSRRDCCSRAIQIASAFVLMLTIARCLDSADGEIRSRQRLTGPNVCGSSGRHCCSGWALSRSRRTCTIPRCDGACGRNGTCISPRMCRCSDGTTSESCDESRSAAETHVPPQMRVFRGQCSRSRRVCKHICLNLTRYLFRCACRQDYNLQPDSRSCESGLNSTSAGAIPRYQTSSNQLPPTRRRRSDIYNSNQKLVQFPDTGSFFHNKDRYNFESKIKNGISDNKNEDQKSVKGLGSSSSKLRDNLAIRHQVFSNQNVKVLKDKEAIANSGLALKRSARKEEVTKAGDRYRTTYFDRKHSPFGHEYLQGSIYKQSAEISGNWDQKYEDLFGEVEKALLDLEQNQIKEIDPARLQDIDRKLQKLDKNTILELNRKKLKTLENRLQDIGNKQWPEFNKNTFQEIEKSRMFGQENHKFQELNQDNLHENHKFQELNQDNVHENYKSKFTDGENELKKLQKSTVPDQENHKWQESQKSRYQGNKMHDSEESKLFNQENKWQMLNNDKLLEFDKRKLLGQEKKRWSELGKGAKQELEKSKLLGQYRKLQELRKRTLLDKESKLQDFEESKLPTRENIKLQELGKDKLRELSESKSLNRENKKLHESDKDTFLKLDKNKLQKLVDTLHDLENKQWQQLDSNKLVNNENKKGPYLDGNKKDTYRKYWQKTDENMVKQVENSRFMESQKKQQQQLDHAHLHNLEKKKSEELGKTQLELEKKKLEETKKTQMQELQDTNMLELQRNKIQERRLGKFKKIEKNKEQKLETFKMPEIEQNTEQEFKKINRQELKRTNLQEFEGKQILALEKSKLKELEKTQVKELEKNKVQKLEKTNFGKDKSDYEHGRLGGGNDHISLFKEPEEPGSQTTQFFPQQGKTSLPTMVQTIISTFKKTSKADFKYPYATNNKRLQKADSEI